MNYKTLADKSSLGRTVSALRTRGYTVITIKNKEQALEEIKRLIPSGVSVMNGSSVTLEQIGYQNYLAQGTHTWIDLHANIHAENDPTKRAQLRKESVVSDYYLGSVHALTETGEAIIASNTGSQLPHIAFTSPNIIFVVSTKKIVPSLEEGMRRLEQHVVPLEDAHMQSLYHIGTALNKILIFKGESKMIGRKITFVLIEEDLGF
jgi:L-lactate utilization protein LutC